MEDLNILIVEDESLIALELSQTIKNFGYKNVFFATNSKKALKLFKENSFNLIIMDINLNEQINGIELYKEFKCNIPVIFITAYKDEDTIYEAIALEPLGYLIKPYNQNELKALLLLAKNKNSMNINTNNKLYLGNDYYFDSIEDKLFFKNNYIHLSKKELELLKLLINAKGNFVSYYTIENEIWPTQEVSRSTIRTLIYRLRGKLNYKSIEVENNFGIRLAHIEK